MIYFLFLMYSSLIVLSLMFVSYPTNNKKEILVLNTVICIFSCFFLSVFGGFRYVGFSPDDLNYAQYFSDYIYSSEIHTNLDIGYVFLMKFVSLFTNDINILFLAIIFISVSITLYCFYKRSLNLPLSVLIFISHVYWFREINQVRAAISYSLILLLLTFFNEINFFKRVSIFISATLFHFSAFFSIFLFFIKKIKINKKVVFCIIFLSTLMGSGGLILSFLSLLNLSDFFLLKINKYMLDSSGYAYSLSIFNPTTLKYFFIFILIMLFYPENEINDNSNDKILIFSYLFSLIWILVFRDFGVVAGRIASMFSVVEPLIIPMIISKIKGVLFKRITTFLFIIFYLAIFIMNLNNRNVIELYHSVLFNGA